MLITGLGDATCPVRWREEAAGTDRHTHTGAQTHTQGYLYILLLQITTCTSRHSSDNTQYYANRRLCDSGAAVGVAHMVLLTADQPTYIPYSSLSAACLPLFPNIWLPHCRFVCPALFPCLNSLPLSSSAQDITLYCFLFQNPFSFFNLSAYLSFSTPQS